MGTPNPKMGGLSIYSEVSQCRSKGCQNDRYEILNFRNIEAPEEKNSVLLRL